MPRARFSRVVAFALALGLNCLGAGAASLATSEASLSVKEGGSFVLVLGAQHAPKLAVIDPDDRLIVLVENYVLNSIMTEQVFLGKTSLDIDTRSLEGVTYNDGEEMIEPVFTKPGLYRFIVSEGLAADPESKRIVTIRVKYG